MYSVWCKANFQIRLLCYFVTGVDSWTINYVRYLYCDHALYRKDIARILSDDPNALEIVNAALALVSEFELDDLCTARCKSIETNIASGQYGNFRRSQKLIKRRGAPCEGHHLLTQSRRDAHPSAQPVISLNCKVFTHSTRNMRGIM